METIHINFSRYVVFVACALLIAVMSLFAIPIVTLIMCGVSSIFSIIGVSSYIKARMRFLEMEGTDIMVDIIFEMEQNIKDNKEL